MDLLGEEPALSLSDENWRIYARHQADAPQYLGAQAQVGDSLITEGCAIYGAVHHCVLASGVKVASGAVVQDSVLFDGVQIGEGAQVKNAILGSGVTVGAGAVIGADREKDRRIAVVGDGIHLPDNATVESGAMLYDYAQEVQV